MIGGAFAAIAVAVACVVSFAAALALTRALGPVMTIYETSVAGVMAMLDPVLDEGEKEFAVRRAGIALIVQSFQVAWRIALALGLAWGLILIADHIGLVPEVQSLGILLRIDFMLIVTAAAILFSWGFRRIAPKDIRTEQITDSSSYSAGDKLIHAFAFSGSGLQKGLAHFDDGLFSRKLAAVPDNPPIFITSLARGGTTALLNAMHDLPSVATHQYSDMPFMTAPMLWSRLGGRRGHVAERERAHGDGLQIGLQSPEAFDEILWMLRWPEKYHDSRIDLWSSGDIRPSEKEFFTNHFRKIVCLRHPEVLEQKQTGFRYVSKNNANIARLGLLPVLFPECRVVIALREPSAHAASLHRQHLNFLKLHSEDEFSVRYMRDIGHLEFGALHRPIAFDLDFISRFDPLRPDYWLAYWITAFESVSDYTERLLIVAQEDLRRAPAKTMEALLTRLEMAEMSGRRFDGYFLDRPDAPRAELFDADLLHRAREIYGRLREVCLC